MLRDRIVRRVEKEVDEVRHNDFRSLIHQHRLDVIVRNGMILDEDFTDNADLWLPELLVNRNMIEVTHDVLDHSAKLEHTAVFEFLFRTRHPLLECRLCCPLHEFVRHHAIAHVHQQIPVNGCLDSIHHHLAVKCKAIRLLGQAAYGKDSDIREARITERLAQHAEIVGRTACAAGLKEGNARMIGVAEPCLECGKELSDDDDRRIAHVIVHVAQPRIDCCLVRHRRNDDVIAMFAHRRSEEFEVNRCHLGRQNCMRFLAVLGEARPLDDGDLMVGRRFSPRERRNQRAQTYPCSAEVRYLVQLDHRVDALM